MSGLKIWVSGSRGFVGKNLIKAFKDPGYEIRCITNSRGPVDGLTYIDFSDEAHIKAAIDLYGVPDVFIHLGWGAVYEPESNKHVTSNVSDGKNLIRELFSSGLERFVFIGSSAEYVDRKGSLSENMSPEGRLNNYVKGKVDVSSYGFETAKRFNKTFIHIRLFYAFGAGQYENSLINQLYRNCVKNSVMNLSPCEHYRDYIHISDVVHGIKLMSKINESAIVNLGSGRAIQLKEFVSLFWKCLGGKSGYLIFGAHGKPEHETEQPQCYANLDTLKRLTHWTPTVSLSQGIIETVAELNKRSTLHEQR